MADREINIVERVAQAERLTSLLTGGGLGGIAGGGVELASTLGAFAKLHPAVTVAALSMGALAGASKLAANTLTELGQATVMTGGSAGQVGTLQALLGAAGVANVAGMARSLREQVAGGGLGTLAGSQLGVPVRPVGVGTPPNEARMLLDAITNLRQMSDQQARLTAERLPTIEPLMILRFASEEQMQRLRQMADQMDRLATPDAIQGAVEFNLQMQQLNLLWKQLVLTLGNEFLPVLNSVLGFLTSDTVTAAGKLAMSSLNPFGGLMGGGGKRGETAQEQQTRAVEQNTAQLEYLNSGLHGAGKRGSAAIPPGLAGDALDRGLRSDSVRLGAY